MGSGLRSAAERRLGDGNGRIGKVRCAVSKPRVHSPANQDGQALVEFALVVPLFVLLVAGIIQFGVALNYWHDLQRIANQGARWAGVNAYPGCPQAGPDAPCEPSLQSYLETEPVSGGLRPDVEICFEAMSGGASGAAIGDAVTVRLRSEFEVVPIVGLGHVDLRAVATMRVEEPPTRYSGELC